jgi:hypothetical protein
MARSSFATTVFSQHYNSPKTTVYGGEQYRICYESAYLRSTTEISTIQIFTIAMPIKYQLALFGAATESND